MDETLSPPLDEARTAFAVGVAVRAARLSKAVQDRLVVTALQKADRSPVTVGDFAVQALVGRSIDDAFPDDVLVGEEDAAALRADDGSETLEQVVSFVGEEVTGARGDRVCDWIDRGGGEPTDQFWTLDPIDGTKGFLRGDQFAMALAWIESGVVELGVLSCPRLHLDGAPCPGALFVARRDRGCWMADLEDLANLRPVKVSRISDPAQARVLRSVEAAHTNTGQFGDVMERLKVGVPPVLMDSQAKYGLLASGKADLLLRLVSPRSPDYREKIWDQAAGSLVLEEAGGRITDLKGRRLDFSQGTTLARNRGVVASNGRIHEAVLEALS